MERVIEFLDTKPEALDSVFLNIDVPLLTNNEKRYIRDFVSIYRPFAQALDILQGETYIYYGCLLPTLELLKEKLLRRKAELSSLSICGPLVLSLIAGKLYTLLLKYYFFINFNNFWLERYPRLKY